jgi:hypothetical protein
MDGMFLAMTSVGVDTREMGQSSNADGVMGRFMRLALGSLLCLVGVLWQRSGGGPPTLFVPLSCVAAGAVTSSYLPCHVESERTSGAS